MTILEKWRFMMLSFADIKAAVIEKGGNISADKGYNRYANAIRQLYSDTYTDEYAYPERLPIAISNAINYVRWCKAVKEQIRQAIIAGGVECGTDVPLSEYGNKIREIQVLQIITSEVIAEYDTPITEQLQASGGQPPYKWSYTNSSRPPGCTITEDGILSGTPTVGNQLRYLYMQVTDATGRTATRRIGLRIKSKLLHFQNVSGSCFQYTGEPQRLRIICTDKPDAEFKVVYGTDKTESVTDCGQYLAEVILTGETAKGGKYRTDYTSVIQIDGWTLAVKAEKSQVYTYDGKPHAFEYTTSVVQDGTPPDGGTVAYYKPYVNGDNTWNADMGEYTTEPPPEMGKYRVCIKATGKYERVTQYYAGYNEWWGDLEITDRLRIISPTRLDTAYNRPYQYQLQAGGGTPPYKWKCEAMPYYGLDMTEDGLISGTPDTKNIMCSYPNGLTVTDAEGNTVTQRFELSIHDWED
ncbi:hypothetical protein FMM68_04955 [Lachnospiraceae bacterium MD329]|nr:hypothetical protein [Lachnospiraceae bacterium MD329]